MIGSNFLIKNCCNNYNNCNLANTADFTTRPTGNSTIANKNDGGLSGGAVAGIVVGSLAGVGILGGAGAFAAYKIRSKKEDGD